MSVVDTSMWKPFRVGDLFDIQKGKRLTKAYMVDGNYPFVGASAVSNGITAFVGNDAYLHDGHCLTVCYNGSVGETFLQKEPFWASDDVNVLRPFDESVSDFALMFVAPCIRSLRRNYGYTNKWTSAKMAEDAILLPATADGEPDWAYMETYMRQVLDREEMFAEHLASLTAEAVADGHVVDTSAWKAFKVTDGLGFICHHGSRLNKSFRIDGDIPFITAGFENRGVSQFIGNAVAVYSDAITVDMFGNCFFQQGRCAGDDNVYFFVNDAISNHCKLFLSFAVHASVVNRFDYSSQFRQSDADSLSVLLPATPDGAPDWAYMEQYMRDVMAVEALFADELDRLSRE